ncbi:WD40 repeat domain-containing protein [Phanerochaete sordida]|uniref:WD40 repeat domain-containing protein n=1 Tax=Phanerochaete sordida TaxID=48140 RepID=A0A9P3GJM4_9APHY|nr:WD40 repeat domain-containing protein [Phanerochaete sordida]
MSSLKNSQFGKRLRASHAPDNDEERGRRNRPRTTSTYGVTPSSSDSLMAGYDSSGAEKSIGHKDYGDRFVPTRDTGDIRTSYQLKDEIPPTTPAKARIIPTESDAQKEQANALFNSILTTEVTPPSPNRAVSPARQASSSTMPTTPTRKRIFAYSSPSHSNSGTPGRRFDTPTDEAYSLSPVRAESRQMLESPRRKLRSVCKTPYRVLDAPELADDFYLNLVDWSSTNVLGVGLGSCVYLWTAHTAAVSKLCDLSDTSDTVSSLSWVEKGTTLAVGTLSGKLHIYDAHTLQRQRTYQQAHSNRIGALSWNQHILSSGSRDRSICHRDVREASTRPFKKSMGHKQEVCGLRWNTDAGQQTALLASGGNDNKVCIWDLRGNKRPGMQNNPTSAPSSGASTSGAEDANDIPVYKFHEHTAAVKALAWDPHISGVLASGGGTADKHIRFWNVYTGTMLHQLDTGSQVCNLTWSLTSHELVSTHGFSSTAAQNQICIWKYPGLNMVASLTGHTHRVLYLAMSPDGETIVTGAGDETLRFWNAFPKKDANRDRRESRLDYSRLIR